MMAITVEAAIIGAGQAGVPLARALAAAGRQVVLIEREHLGGSCVNFGCTPSKAVIASARLAHQARHAAEWGVRIPMVEVDFAAVMDRARRLVAEAKGSLDQSFADKDNPSLITAHASLDGWDGALFRIRAGRETVLAEQVVLDTGTRTAVPGIKGLDRVPFTDAETWIGMRELPRRLIILGGGYVALELGQSYRRFGAEVVIVEQGSQIAEREDPDVAEILHYALEAEGIDVRTGSEVERVEGTDGDVRVHLRSDKAVTGTHLLVATGRQPNTDDLGLDTVGVRLSDRGVVEVDEHLRTSVPGMWAAGDIRGGPQFTHTAYDDYRVIRAQLLGTGERTTRQRIVPYAMFTEPELGRVGLTETQAREQRRPVRVGRFHMSDSGKAKELGKTAGIIKVLVGPDTDTILGAAALGEQGAEVVQLFVELMNAGASARTMLDAVHIHPTLAEAAKNAVAAALDAH